MKKYCGISWFGLIIAVLIGIMAALLLLAVSGYGYTIAQAEAVPSPTVRGMYSIESDTMRISEAPAAMTIMDIAMVDIDVDKANETGRVMAKVRFPAAPDDGIACVILFDGRHIAHGGWMRTEDEALIVTFAIEDLLPFDGTVGLYLVLIGHNEN